MAKNRKYIVKYNHKVYKPDNYDVMKYQEKWELPVYASSLEEVAHKLKIFHNLNPFYFKTEGFEFAEIKNTKK